MKTQLDNILKAINLASYDSAEVLSVELQDLRLLRSVIMDQNTALKNAEREIHILSAKLALKDIERPMKLRAYIEAQKG